MDPMAMLTLGQYRDLEMRSLVGMSESGREWGLKSSVLWQEGQVGEMTFGLP